MVKERTPVTAVINASTAVYVVKFLIFSILNLISPLLFSALQRDLGTVHNS